jgi:hypothetical protein
MAQVLPGVILGRRLLDSSAENNKVRMIVSTDTHTKAIRSHMIVRATATERYAANDITNHHHNTDRFPA